MAPIVIQLFQRQVAVLFAPAFLALSCASLPWASDPDASSETASPLTLGETHTDQLDCRGEGAGDCSDWFKINFPTRAQLRVDVKTHTPDGHTGAAPTVVFSLHDEAGKQLRKRGPGASLRTRKSLDPGDYLIHVQAGSTTGSVSYELGASPVSFRVASWPVLSVESPSGEGRARVLIGGGSEDGLKVGFAGRLLSGGRSLSRVKVVEVYPEGALLELLAPLKDPLGGDAMAEIELPPGR